jgi:rSAM/selenodomain-associated transferase 2
MELSIVIPAWNEAPGIAHAVRRAWAVGPRDVIVVDGGSQDQTVQRAESAGADVLRSARGRGAQQNLGAAQAAGDVLLFLHADTWLDPLGRHQIEAALGDPRVLGGAFRQQIEAAGLGYRLLERGNAWRVSCCQIPYGDQGIFLRRQAFDELGRFPETRLLEDWLLMQRARRSGRIVLLEGPLHVSPRRWQRQGIVRQTLRNWAILAAARLGVPPDRLAEFYRPHAAE